MPKLSSITLSHRCQAVGGTGGIRDDVMPGGIILILVYPHDKGLYIALGRRRDDDLFGAGIDMRAGTFSVTKDPSTLGNIVHTNIPPGNFPRIFYAGNLNKPPIDIDALITAADVTGVGPPSPNHT